MRDTATAHIALGDDGVIVVQVRPDIVQRPADAHENLETAIVEADGRRRPILIDITRARHLDAETRHVYSGQKLVVGFTALALLVEGSPLGLMIGNVYFRLARPGIPRQLFTDAERARDWLQGYLV